MGLVIEATIITEKIHIQLHSSILCAKDFRNYSNLGILSLKSITINYLALLWATHWENTFQKFPILYQIV